MKFNEFKDYAKQPDLIQGFRDFLPIAIAELKLKTLPKIRLEKYLEQDEQPSFGRFMHSKDHAEIHLAIKDRHPIDIIRTLAHELVHFKQYTENRLTKDSGKTGSPDENEAHITAGVIMRDFNKKFPEHFNNSSITLDENFKDGRNPQDKGDSERHNVPTKASVSTLRKVAKGGGRRGQLAHWMANMKSGRNKESNENQVDEWKHQIKDPAKATSPMHKLKIEGGFKTTQTAIYWFRYGIYYEALVNGLPEHGSETRKIVYNNLVKNKTHYSTLRYALEKQRDLNNTSNEEYATGDKAQVKGKDPMPKAKLGRTDHPFHGKLVGGT